MKKRYYLLPALLYLLAAAGSFIYGYTEVKEDLPLSPLRRLILLLGICLCVYLAGRILCKKPGANRQKIMKRTFRFILLLYAVLLFTLTLFDPNFGRTGTVSFLFSDKELMKAYLESSVNLTPFETVERYLRAWESNRVNDSVIVTNLLGNFTALMPMALLLPLSFDKCRKFGRFFLITTGTVLLIEGLQLLFMTGSCDIDDLILNVTGACIAFGILQIPPIRRGIEKLTLCTEKSYRK